MPSVGYLCLQGNKFSQSGEISFFQCREISFFFLLLKIELKLFSFFLSLLKIELILFCSISVSLLQAQTNAHTLTHKTVKYLSLSFENQVDPFLLSLCLSLTSSDNAHTHTHTHKTVKNLSLSFLKIELILF